ncbi:hypothetical protein ACTTAM_10185 [Rhodobacter capsulatus]|uniref:hypothetical protein n=1 Tax=Rhodobacter capsulatus TaxID=1061 RepID=UPI00402A0AA5
MSLDAGRVAELLDLTAALIAETRPAVVLASHAALELDRLATRRARLTGRPARLSEGERGFGRIRKGTAFPRPYRNSRGMTVSASGTEACAPPRRRECARHGRAGAGRGPLGPSAVMGQMVRGASAMASASSRHSPRGARVRAGS